MQVLNSIFFRQRCVALFAKGGVALLAALTITGACAQSGNTADLIGTVREGFYRMPSLPAGRYSVRAPRQRFADAVNANVVLQIGQVTTVDLNLSVAAEAQSVSVSSAPPIVEAERTSVGSVVNRTDIDNLPINGRNFLNFALTVGALTAQQTSGQGSGLSFNGQRGRSKSIMAGKANAYTQGFGDPSIQLYSNRATSICFRRRS